MSFMRRLKKTGASQAADVLPPADAANEARALPPLNEFESHLLLLAKHHYWHKGSYADGARIVVAHIAGIPMEQAQYRDIAGWLIQVLVWIDHSAPRALAGGMARALNDFLDRVEPKPTAPVRTAGQYWRQVVDGLMGQIAIAQIKNGDETYFQMSEIDLAIQAALSDTLIPEEPVVPASVLAIASATTIHVPLINGVQVMSATEEQIDRVKQTPNQVYAELLGFECAADYREWFDTAGTLFCPVENENSRPCHRRVAGDRHLSPSDWRKAKKSDPRCNFHGGPVARRAKRKKVTQEK